MKQMERNCIICGVTVSCLCKGASSFCLFSPPTRDSHPGGVASMTRDIPWLASVERPPPSAAILWPG